MQWGVAFELEGNDKEVAATVQYLEWREKQYDQRELVDIHARDGTVIVQGALCYIASDSRANANWLGPAPIEAIAAQVRVHACTHGQLLACRGRSHALLG
jgi:hypothetical protein